MTWGAETVVFFEIDQPFCLNTYGAAPCAAVLGTTGAIKCYNGRSTCQSVPTYNPGTLTLRFSMPNDDLIQYGNVIPSVISVSTTAGSINLGGMDPAASPLGQREAVTVKLNDHKHSDLLVDQYRLERITGAAAFSGVPLDPYNSGTFWGKWRARNPYATSYPSYRARIRRGFVGQALADMSVRSYVIDRVEVADDGTASFMLKDVFTKLQAKKSVAPLANKGALLAGISAVAGAATLTPAGIGNAEYGAAGHLVIGDELITFTRVGDNLTLTQRGALNTVAAAHDASDTVQMVLEFVAQSVTNIVYPLMLNFTPLLPTDLPKADWDAAATAAGMTNLYTAYITKPTPVEDLVGELSEQAGFSLYPNPATGLVEFIPLVAGAASVTVNDDGWIIDKSLSTKKQETKRVSEVWVYYGQKNPTVDLSEVTNYSSRKISDDPGAEQDAQYGAPAINEVFSRWIPQFGSASATQTAERLLTMFRDPPDEAKFSIHKNRTGILSPGGLLSIVTDHAQDVTGANATQTHAVISVQHDENEDVVQSQQTTFATPSGIRDVLIDSDTQNINLRTQHDLLFTAPTGTEHVRFTVLGGVRIGSVSTALHALRSGAWPAGVVLDLVISGGALDGASGVGGNGGNADGVAHTADAGTNGTVGGPALLAEAPINVTNNGEINGGGGGGGGGGGVVADRSLTIHVVGGSAAGAGRGNVAAAAGNVGLYSNPVGGFPDRSHNGNPASAASVAGSGTGGAAVGDVGAAGITYNGGAAGDGGDWGQPGQNGQPGAVTANSIGADTLGAAGLGAAAGAAVDGNAFVTWVVAGTLRGALNP
jgi:hypothetical protein